MSWEKAKRFEDLEIWKLARTLCQKLWILTEEGTFAKDYSLRNQINAASGSVMDNIAEGFERSGNKEYIQFLYIAKGSAGEVRSQIIRAYDRNHISKEKSEELYKDVKNLGGGIMNLIKSIKASDYKGYKYKN